MDVPRPLARAVPPGANAGLSAQATNGCGPNRRPRPPSSANSRRPRPPSSANRGRGARPSRGSAGRRIGGAGRRVAGAASRGASSIRCIKRTDATSSCVECTIPTTGVRPQALRAPAGLPAVRFGQDRAPDARSRRVRPRLGSLTGRIVRSAHSRAVGSSSAAEMHRARQSHPRQHFVSSGVWLHAAKSSASPDAT
jgi:hypothetical protein